MRRINREQTENELMEEKVTDKSQGSEVSLHTENPEPSTTPHVLHHASADEEDGETWLKAPDAEVITSVVTVILKQSDWSRL